jgi:hypothetical protein
VEIENFGLWFSTGPLAFRDIWWQADVISWADELAALRAAPVEHFAEQMIHCALTERALGRRIPLDAFQRSEDLRARSFTRVEADHPASAACCRSPAPSAVAVAVAVAVLSLSLPTIRSDSELPVHK